MGETDEFVPQPSHVEDEAVQEQAAEESAVPMTDEPADPIVEQPVAEPAETPIEESVDAPAETPIEESVDAPAETPIEESVDASAETNELDEISQSLSDEVASGADSFDDIAAPVPAAVAVPNVPEPLAVGQVPWWPFMVYLGAWVVLAAAAVWQLLKLPADQVVYESTAYVLTILGGLIMTAVGPLLILAVWLGTRANRVAKEREGLLTSALMKGALVTLGGAIIWWASLVIIDYLRLGRLL